MLANIDIGEKSRSASGCAPQQRPEPNNVTSEKQVYIFEHGLLPVFMCMLLPRNIHQNSQFTGHTSAIVTVISMALSPETLWPSDLHSIYANISRKPISFMRELTLHQIRKLAGSGRRRFDLDQMGNNSRW